MIFKNRQKIGEIRPIGVLSLDDTIIIDTGICKCGKIIVKLPTSHVESLPFYYDEFRYTCLFCNWESNYFRKRTL